MKNFKIIMVVLMFLGTGSFVIMGTETAKNQELRHVVAFKFKPDAVKNEEDLAAYGAHPDHQAFSEAALLLLDEVIVVDYWK
jgi:hypothetical protein